MAIDTNLATAVVSASGAVIVSITALLVNSKRFDDLGRRIDDLRSETNRRMDAIEATLVVIQADLKEFYRDITRLKQKTGLE